MANKIKSAGDGTNQSPGDATWSNSGVGGIGGSDDNYASVILLANSSFLLRADFFQFGLAVDDVIVGYEVLIEKGTTGVVVGDIVDLTVKLWLSGAIGNNKADTVTPWPPGADEVITYGGPTDLWGTSLSASQVNQTDFGCVIAATTAGSGQADVDHMRIRVYYTSAAEETDVGSIHAPVIRRQSKKILVAF